METNTKLELFIKAFAFRDGLFRAVSLIGSTFAIAAISLLPGFGVKGLLIATSIQLLLSGLLEIPTSIAADKFGRSLILRVSLALKILVSVALGIAIYFASKGESQYVWYAFFFEAFIDAISNTLLSGSYQVAYLTLYDQIQSENGERPPLFLKSYEYGIKFRIFFPVLFVIFIIATFLIFESSHQNLYYCAYLILSAILLARIALFIVVNKDFKSVNLNNDRARLGIKDGLLEVSKIISNRKTLFFTYSVTALFNFVSILYLTGQAMKELKAIGFNSHYTWMAAIGSSVLIYLLRTFAAIALLPKISKDVLNIMIPFFGFLVFLGGVSLSGIDWLFDSNYFRFCFFIILTTILFVISDALSKSIESSLKDLVQSEFKATWISLGNTLAYLVFGASSVLISGFVFSKANILIGSLIAIAGLFILISQILSNKGLDAPSFKEVLRAQLLKALSFIVILIVAIDLTSYAFSTQRQINEITARTSHTVLLGIKSSVLQGDLIEASNFLYSLKSGNFISCFKLNLKLAETNDCELNGESQAYSDFHKFEIKYDENSFGTIALYFDFSPIRKDLYFRIIIDIVFSFILYSFLFYVFHIISRTVGSEVELLHKAIAGTEKDDNTSFFRIREFKQINQHLFESLNLREKVQFQTAMINVASQVSHDIRSPLTALGLVTHQLPQIPEEKRIIIRSAVNRINDIANQLLQKSREERLNKSIDTVKNEPVKVAELKTELLGPLVDGIISEKRVQNRDYPEVEIGCELKSSYGLFVSINPVEFKRALSNLINNSVEALPNKRGSVTVDIISRHDTVMVTIADTGSGIPEDVLRKLGDRGITHGKEGSASGSGLGIYHAKQVIEATGGTFEIKSKVGVGTTVILFFPKAKTPDWFVEKLTINDSSQIVALDDDISIHQVWNDRFENRGHEFPILSFTTAESLKKWYCAGGRDHRRSYLFLFDFELLGQCTNGLKLIEDLEIEKQSILVTSRYEEENIRKVCNELGVKLIPKPMAGLVPIELVQSKQSFDRILIDDDPLVNRPIETNSSPMRISVEKVRYDLCLIDDDQALIGVVWAMEAESKGLKIRLFATPQAFVAEADNIDPQTPIYVDVSLGNGVNGLDVAHDIHKMGFTEINLATGYQADSMKVPPFICRVVGKDFPDVGYAGAPTS